VLFVTFGLLELARTPSLLAMPVEAQYAQYADAVKVEIWTNALAAALEIALGGAFFFHRSALAARLEPATGGDAFSSIGVQALAYALVGVYFLVPALAHILSYVSMNGYSLSGEWKIWSASLFQVLLALALILGARRLPRLGSS
jgi:hypothetical protein